MILGIASSIVTTKGADWVDNNFDNLVLATKNTFNNQGKTVTLGSNGGNIISDFSNEFKKAKANNVSSVKDIEIDSNANAINGSGDVIETSYVKLYFKNLYNYFRVGIYLEIII